MRLSDWRGTGAEWGEAQRAAVRTFEREARAFCAALESEPRWAPRRARALFARVYAAGCALPAADDAPDVDEPSVTAPSSFEGVEGVDLYRDVLDVHSSAESPPSLGSLLDDARDVYLELQRGLRLWDAGHEVAAAWTWRFGFDAHWGSHAAGALRALQAFLR